MRLSPIDSTQTQWKVTTIEETSKPCGKANPEPPTVAMALDKWIVPTHVPSLVANWGLGFPPTASSCWKIGESHVSGWGTRILCPEAILNNYLNYLAYFSLHCYGELLRRGVTEWLGIGKLALATYIHKRAGSARYYVRVTVPSDLAKDYGRTEIWKSLGTASPAEAKVKAPGVYMAIQDEFTARRRSREIVENDVAAIAWKHYSELIENDERFRDQNLTDEQLDELWRELEAEFGEYDMGAYQAFADIRDRIETYKNLRERSRSLLTSGEPNKMLEAVAESVDEHIAAYRAALPKTSPTYRKVAMGVARAEMEALKRADERDVMDWTGTPADPLIKRAEKPKAALPGSRLMDFYKLFITQRGNGLKEDTRDQNEGIVQLFAEFFGEDMPLDKLERKHVAGWRDQLYLFPAKAKQIRELKDLKFKEIITKNKELGRKTIDPKTINKYLSAIGPFLKWLLSNGHIAAPAISDEMYIRLDRDRKRDPFSDER
jgi:hypothetical protein